MGVVGVREVVTKVIIDVEIGIGKDGMLNINKNSSLTITVIPVNDNNIK